MKSTKKKNTTPVERTSADIVGENVERLKELFPEAVAEGKVDFEKLKAMLGEIVDDRPDQYSFTWAGKRNAVRLLQMPSRATLKPCPKESVNWNMTKNIFIEGENLEVLKLLYKSYAGRVKMIYIDPPYNTGNDFIYMDDFADPLDTYLKLTYQKDAEGNLLTSNPETSGRYHSSWLSMMYPRLFVARQLLQEDGLIFVSIDDKEIHNIRLVMDAIFGEENFIDNIIWKKRYGGGAKEKYLISLQEYILLYARNKKNLPPLYLPYEEESIKRYYTRRDEKYETRGPYRTHPLEATKSMGERKKLVYPIPAPDGSEVLPKRQWLWSKERAMHALKAGELEFQKNREGGWTVHTKQYLKDEEGKIRESKAFSIIDDVYTQHGTNEIIELFGDAHVFPFPKPTGLMVPLLKIATSSEEEEIILDFFAGSGTLAHAVLQENRADAGYRRFIMVQLPEPTHRKDYKTIADIGKERIRRVIKKLKDEAKKQQELFKDRETPEDLGFRVFKLTESNYRQWRGLGDKDGEKYAEEMKLFTDPLLPGWKLEDVVWEVALKEGYNLSSIVEEVKGVKGNRIWRVTDADRGQSFQICLDDKLKDSTVKALKLDKESLFVCRDAALTDEQAANLALTCKLKTI
jgi:adenine-specific DNA-methyltransferase